MEILKNASLGLKNLSENIGKQQREFLETDLGKAVNTGIDIGLRISLPDFLEDEIIKIKDALLTEGFSSIHPARYPGVVPNISAIFSRLSKGMFVTTPCSYLYTA